MADDEKSNAPDLRIETNLKRVYKDVLEGEIPTRFADLIDQLKGSSDPADSNPGLDT
ncbi:MAG: NepR family anti-sigma factor [Paracoccaceae bacterium]